MARQAAGKSLEIRMPESIHAAGGEIENGSFRGRWHFSFGDYRDPEHERFGTLRVFNDDTLSPGATWPLHPHREIEVVTYCAEGEFGHADRAGRGGVLRKGWVQHTTVGRGMWHSEINNRPDVPMRFIQMWFTPALHGIEPSYEQMAVERMQRTNRLLPLVSNGHAPALPILSDAQVFSCFLERERTVSWLVPPRRGAYLYVVEGGTLHVNGHPLPALGAVEATGPLTLRLAAEDDAELLLVDVGMEAE